FHVTGVQTCALPISSCRGCSRTDQPARPGVLVSAVLSQRSFQATSQCHGFRNLGASDVVLVRRDRYSSQNTDDGHHDHQFDQGKTLRSEEHTSELQSREKLVCRLLLEKKKA